jgi:hypothetical protein
MRIFNIACDIVTLILGIYLIFHCIFTKNWLALIMTITIMIYALSDLTKRINDENSK